MLNVPDLTGKEEDQPEVGCRPLRFPFSVVSKLKFRTISSFQIRRFGFDSEDPQTPLPHDLLLAVILDGARNFYSSSTIVKEAYEV